MPQCPEVAQSLIPRMGMYRPCALEVGHEGPHRPSGTCFTHGPYTDFECPDCPLPEITAGSWFDFNGVANGANLNRSILPEDMRVAMQSQSQPKQEVPVTVYKKRPVEVRTVLTSDCMRASRYCPEEIPPFIQEAFEKGLVIFLADCMVIKTLEGDHRSEPTDIIIEGVHGELYPCKPDIFTLTYEKVA